jgi:hypothetical protein
MSAEPIEITQARWRMQRAEKVAMIERAKFEILQLKDKIKTQELNIAGWEKEVMEIDEIIRKNSAQYRVA